MAEWTEDQKLFVWGQCQCLPDASPCEYRLDSCGAIIKYSEYGNQDSECGWQIDHIYPEKKLKDANVEQSLIDGNCNIQALHWRNNLKKSDEYPQYEYTTVRMPGAFCNLTYEQPKKILINSTKRNELQSHFANVKLDCNYIVLPIP